MNDLNKKSVEELKKLEEESRAELFALRFQSAMGNLEKPHRIGELKKQIARILTILSTRKNVGENMAINVKINLSETYAKIEKESQAFVKQRKRKAKIEQMMAEQQAAEGQMPNLMVSPLNDAMDLTPAESAVAVETEEVKPVAEKKPATTKAASSTVKKTTVDKKDVAKAAKPDKDAALKTLIKENDAAKKTAAKSKTTLSLAKAEIEVPKGAKKTVPTKTVKKDTELNAKEKLAAIKSSVVMDGTVKGRGSAVKIDLDLKTKDPKATEYTYGTNWKENRDKILIAGKTTKKADDKTAKKGTEKNNGKK